MRVFLLNGPPGIGKDTLAANIERLFGYPTLMFKTALYAETANHFNVSLTTFIDVATDRATKEQPFMVLGGMSPRGALIHVSEQLIKPVYGKKFFGLKAVEAIKALDWHGGAVVFSDSGFVEETECLVEHGYEVHIIQLHNKDFDFKQDSREYISVPGATVHKLNVTMGQPMMDVSYFIDIVEKLDQ